jgi:hypothetical protein
MLNNEEFDYLGITAFHKAGYTGKNIKIASCEGIIEGSYNDVICPIYRKGEQGQHGTQVMNFIRQVVPDSEKHAIQLRMNNLEPYRDMDVITSSFTNSTYRDKRVKAFFQELINNDTFLCCAVGNDGTKSQTTMSKQTEWISVGAMSYKDMKKRYYSSVTQDLDFMSFDGLESDYKYATTGTSFASPLFAGMVGLVQDYFIQNTGKKLPYTNLLEFIKAHCIDYSTLGFDNLYGYGLFLLPDPNKIDPNKWNKPIKNKKPLKKLLINTLLSNRTGILFKLK